MRPRVYYARLFACRLPRCLSDALARCCLLVDAAFRRINTRLLARLILLYYVARYAMPRRAHSARQRAITLFSRCRYFWSP